MGINNLCYPIKVGILDLMTSSKILSEVILIKSGPHAQRPILIKINLIAQNKSENLKTYIEGYPSLKLTFQDNRTVKISVQGCLAKVQAQYIFLNSVSSKIGKWL